MKLRSRFAVGLSIALLACVALLSSCNMLPTLDDRGASTALTDTGNTRLGKAIVPLVDAHPGLSAVYPLTSGRDAFAARVLLAGVRSVRSTFSTTSGTAT